MPWRNDQINGVPDQNGQIKSHGDGCSRKQHGQDRHTLGIVPFCTFAILRILLPELGLIDLLVYRAGFQQLCMGASAYHCPILQYQDLICML